MGCSSSHPVGPDAMDLEDLIKMSIADTLRKKYGNKHMVSIGTIKDPGRQSYGNKSYESFLGGEIDPVRMRMGFVSKKGLKSGMPNQDSWMVLHVADEFSIYGVFDGHGKAGHDVSNLVREVLPKLIVQDPRFVCSQEIGRVCIAAFERAYQLIVAADKAGQFDGQLSGTTGTVVVHDLKLNKFTFAHVADSTAVLGRIAAVGGYEVAFATNDHKPSSPREVARIEASGGVVYEGRVYVKGDRVPGINMSRCIGDIIGHEGAGVSSEPEIYEHTITESDKILLVCSDGVWTWTRPEEALAVVAKFDASQGMEAAETLAKEAWGRWIQMECGVSADDITVLVLYL